MTPEQQAAAGITDSLLRLSVGIEAPEDLVADLTAGLERAARVSGTDETDETVNSSRATVHVVR
jgi:hypothetical protein